MPPLRYLIVDDSPTVRLTIKQALAQENVPAEVVSEAGSASEAVAAFDQARPHVVFLDITLSEGAAGGPMIDLLHQPRNPNQSGNDVARYMLQKSPDLTIVVCTGNPSDDPRVRALIKAGAFQVLQKPIRLAQIRDVLRQIQAERAG
ncbi:MAG TPA: response regulator [Thermoplasmata archaeon]|nr:response regulator [Thermoplasmata archaeon]